MGQSYLTVHYLAVGVPRIAQWVHWRIFSLESRTLCMRLVPSTCTPFYCCDGYNVFFLRVILKLDKGRNYGYSCCSGDSDSALWWVSKGQCTVMSEWDRLDKQGSTWLVSSREIFGTCVLGAQVGQLTSRGQRDHWLLVGFSIPALWAQELLDFRARVDVISGHRWDFQYVRSGCMSWFQWPQLVQSLYPRLITQSLIDVIYFWTIRYVDNSIMLSHDRLRHPKNMITETELKSLKLNSKHNPSNNGYS